MENQRIEILHQIQMLESGDIPGPENGAVISHLKKRYNETVETIYQNTHGLFWDIIEVLPEDIWIQIIQEALPTYQYAAALLTLTMVSSKWLQVLTFTPILWTYIEICGSDEDSLATAGIFTRLSREAPLAVTIYLPFKHDATTVLSMLATVGGRIQRIALATDKRVHGQLTLRRIPSETYYAGIRFLIDAVKHTPTVSVIEIGTLEGSPRHDQEVMEMAPRLLSPLIRVLHGYCFCESQDLEHLLHLQELSTCEDLNTLVPRLKNMTRLCSLTLLGRGDKAENPRGLIEAFMTPSNLTTLSIYRCSRVSWSNLLTAGAPNLLNLKLHSILLPQLPSMINIIRSCVKLRTLSLRISHQSDPVLKVRPVSAIAGLTNLRSLEFTCFVSYNAIDDERRPMYLEQLGSVITSITELARRVEEATFGLAFANEEYFTYQVLGCISKLPNLKRLKLYGVEWPITLDQRHVTTLQRLEELDTRFHEAFGAPNLLAAIGRRGISDLSMPEYDNVRTLNIDDHDARWIRFPQDSLPHLIKLKLTLHDDHHLQLGPFLLLTSISIDSRPAGATSLCIALLYQPEDCPCLCDIEFFDSSPEWDILFIMLERRNFSTNYPSSRIRRISFPFISNGLLAPLARLLRGIYGNRPSNQDLSFEGVVNLIFDKQISGCLGCLRNKLPCNEPVVILDDRLGPEELDLSIYSTVDNPPPLDLDSAVVDWIDRREMHILSWKSAAEDFGQQWWRREMCNKQADARVEITEHDVYVEW